MKNNPTDNKLELSDEEKRLLVDMQGAFPKVITATNSNHCIGAYDEILAVLSNFGWNDSNFGIVIDRLLAKDLFAVVQPGTGQKGIMVLEFNSNTLNCITSIKNGWL